MSREKLLYVKVAEGWVWGVTEQAGLYSCLRVISQYLIAEILNQATAGCDLEDCIGKAAMAYFVQLAMVGLAGRLRHPWQPFRCD